MIHLPKNSRDSVFKINTSSGTGTGFYLKDKNILVTNFHVVQGYRTVAIEDQQKKRYTARVVLVNPYADLAFLQPVRGLHGPPAAFDSFSGVENREQVFVLGFPFGMPYTETKGIVSSAKQLMDGRHYIQTDAAVNPGNSGGPVVNTRGELVGITTSKFTNADNMGFAIPVEVLSEDLESLRLNDARKYAVKCDSCKMLIFDKTEYCTNCGNMVDSNAFEQVSPNRVAVFVEEALSFLGLDPVLARNGEDYWEFHYGSTLVTIYFHDREYLHTMSPINELPTGNLEPLFKYLLKMPLPTYKLGVLDNKIFFS
ncbi:MAG: trypsin-like serine protease [bacterium]|nr:trypsin-like serine protease [bacterium]